MRYVSSHYVYALIQLRSQRSSPEETIPQPHLSSSAREVTWASLPRTSYLRTFPLPLRVLHLVPTVVVLEKSANFRRDFLWGL